MKPPRMEKHYYEITQPDGETLYVIVNNFHPQEKEVCSLLLPGLEGATAQEIDEQTFKERAEYSEGPENSPE